MPRIRTMLLGNKTFTLPHPFEEEINSLVFVNHKLVIEKINATAEEQISKAEQESDDQNVGSEIDFIESQADDLKREATNFALVALVTRFQHWVRDSVEELTTQSAACTSLAECLEVLKQQFGDGPTPADYFVELETVRDSIIHSDSKAEWMYRKKLRSVAQRYRDSSLAWVNFGEDHLHEAIEHSIKQIRWYDDRLAVKAASHKK
jgi:hypothetical protein